MRTSIIITILIVFLGNNSYAQSGAVFPAESFAQNINNNIKVSPFQRYYRKYNTELENKSEPKAKVTRDDEFSLKKCIRKILKQRGIKSGKERREKTNQIFNERYEVMSEKEEYIRRRTLYEETNNYTRSFYGTVADLPAQYAIQASKDFLYEKYVTEEDIKEALIEWGLEFEVSQCNACHRTGVVDLDPDAYMSDGWCKICQRKKGSDHRHTTTCKRCDGKGYIIEPVDNDNK